MSVRVLFNRLLLLILVPLYEIFIFGWVRSPGGPIRVHVTKRKIRGEIRMHTSAANCHARARVDLLIRVLLFRSLYRAGKELSSLALVLERGHVRESKRQFHSFSISKTICDRIRFCFLDWLCAFLIRTDVKNCTFII